MTDPWQEIAARHAAQHDRARRDARHAGECDLCQTDQPCPDRPTELSYLTDYPAELGGPRGRQP